MTPSGVDAETRASM